MQLVCATVFLGVSSTALATGPFSGVEQAGPTSAPTAAPPASGDLAPTPLEADLLNFSMRVPTGTSVRIERAPSPSYLLAEASDNPRWRMRAAALRASRLGTTAQSQCQDFLAELKAKGQQFTLLLDEPRSIAGRQAHLFYISVPIEGGGAGISGTLMVPTGPDQYLVFSLVALEEGFDRTRSLLDKSFATLTLVEKSAVLDERATLLGRGEAIVASITPDALRATITKEPLFYRMWKPDEKGAPHDSRIRFLEGPTNQPVMQIGPDGEETIVLMPGDWSVLVSSPTHVPQEAKVSLDPGEFETLTFRFTADKPLPVCEETVVLHDINFDFDIDTPMAESLPILRTVALSLKDCPDVYVEIGGHTDSKGSDEYNLSLSERRMNSVKQILIGYGINEKRMTAKGYGEAKPMTTNNTDEGRALNRRVEFVPQLSPQDAKDLQKADDKEKKAEEKAKEKTEEKAEDKAEDKAKKAPPSP